MGEKRQTSSCVNSKKAMKYVRGYRNILYPERLRCLGMYSDTYQLLRGDLILSANTKHENHPCRSLFMIPNNTSLRGHQMRPSQQQSRKNSHSFFLFRRIRRLWRILSNLSRFHLWVCLKIVWITISLIGALMYLKQCGILYTIYWSHLHLPLKMLFYFSSHSRNCGVMSC